MMLKYAAHRGLRRPLIQVPVLTPRLSSYWVDLFTPISPSISRPLIEGLRSEVVCRDGLARELFPNFNRCPMRPPWSSAAGSEFRPGGRAVGEQQAESKPSLRQPFLEHEGWVADIREGRVTASPSQVFQVVEGIGGRRGWFYATALWRLRALLDRILGGSAWVKGAATLTSCCPAISWTFGKWTKSSPAGDSA